MGCGGGYGFIHIPPHPDITMQIRKLIIPGLVLGAALAQPAAAQSVLPFSFEVRGGAAIPQGDDFDGVSTGFSVGGTVHYQVAPMVGIYGGFEYAKFTFDDDSEDVDSNISDSGFRLGARFAIPLGAMTGVSPWVEGGATFNQTSINLSNDGGNSVGVDSDRALGYEVGAGLSFAVAPKISITPGVRWRSHKADFGDTDDGPAEVDVNQFTVDLGVHISL
jgi:opacity protein-like surface antigen